MLNSVADNKIYRTLTDNITSTKNHISNRNLYSKEKKRFDKQSKIKIYNNNKQIPGLSLKKKKKIKSLHFINNILQPNIIFIMV